MDSQPESENELIKSNEIKVHDDSLHRGRLAVHRWLLLFVMEMRFIWC